MFSLQNEDYIKKKNIGESDSIPMNYDLKEKLRYEGIQGLSNYQIRLFK